MITTYVLLIQRDGRCITDRIIPQRINPQAVVMFLKTHLIFQSLPSKRQRSTNIETTIQVFILNIQDLPSSDRQESPNINQQILRKGINNIKRVFIDKNKMPIRITLVQETNLFSISILRT